MDLFNDYSQRLQLEKLVIGLEEDIAIEGIGNFLAKIDSGNCGYNVLHGENVKQVGQVVIFKTCTSDGEEKYVSKHIIQFVNINIGSGIIEKRPVVSLTVYMGTNKYENVLFSIADRTKSIHKVLICKDFIQNQLDALIDVGGVRLVNQGVKAEYITEAIWPFNKNTNKEAKVKKKKKGMSAIDKVLAFGKGTLRELQIGGKFTDAALIGAYNATIDDADDDKSNYKDDLDLITKACNESKIKKKYGLKEVTADDRLIYKLIDHFGRYYKSKNGVTDSQKAIFAAYQELLTDRPKQNTQNTQNTQQQTQAQAQGQEQEQTGTTMNEAAGDNKAVDPITAKKIIDARKQFFCYFVELGNNIQKLSNKCDQILTSAHQTYNFPVIVDKFFRNYNKPSFSSKGDQQIKDNFATNMQKVYASANSQIYGVFALCWGEKNKRKVALWEDIAILPGKFPDVGEDIDQDSNSKYSKDKYSNETKNSNSKKAKKQKEEKVEDTLKEEGISQETINAYNNLSEEELRVRWSKNKILKHIKLDSNPDLNNIRSLLLNRIEKLQKKSVKTEAFNFKNVFNKAKKVIDIGSIIEQSTDKKVLVDALQIVNALYNYQINKSKETQEEDKENSTKQEAKEQGEQSQETSETTINQEELQEDKFYNLNEGDLQNKWSENSILSNVSFNSKFDFDKLKQLLLARITELQKGSQVNEAVKLHEKEPAVEQSFNILVELIQKFTDKSALIDAFQIVSAFNHSNSTSTTTKEVQETNNEDINDEKIKSTKNQDLELLYSYKKEWDKNKVLHTVQLDDEIYENKLSYISDFLQYYTSKVNKIKTGEKQKLSLNSSIDDWMNNVPHDILELVIDMVQKVEAKKEDKETLDKIVEAFLVILQKHAIPLIQRLIKLKERNNKLKPSDIEQVLSTNQENQAKPIKESSKFLENYILNLSCQDF